MRHFRPSSTTVKQLKWSLGCLDRSSSWPMKKKAQYDLVVTKVFVGSEPSKSSNWQCFDIFQDEPGTLQLLKTHLALEQTVETYAETVGMLSQQCQYLLEIGHPERCDMIHHCTANTGGKKSGCLFFQSGNRVFCTF